MIDPDQGLLVRIRGEGAAQACAEARALLVELGRPAVVVAPGDPGTPALVAAGLVVLVPGGADGTPDAELDLTGVPEVERARRILAVADREREIASRAVFVVGAGRSGTTWVLDLLGSHPEVAALFETRLFDPHAMLDLRYRLGYDPDRVREMRGRAEGPGQLVSRDEAIAELRAKAASWLARTVGPEHRWLVEKTPNQGLSASVMAEVFPEARFVHVVRDARDVAVSRRAADRTWMRLPRPSSTLVKMPIAWRAAREWATMLAAMDRLDPAIPVLELRYERLHADPVATVGELFAFCEVPIAEDEIRAIVARNAFDRLPDRGPGRPQRAGRVGDWQTELGFVGRQLVMGAAGEALAARGYVNRPGVVARAAAAFRSRL